MVYRTHQQKQLQITMTPHRLSELPIEFVSSARRISGSLDKIAQLKVPQNQLSQTSKKIAPVKVEEKKGTQLVAARNLKTVKTKNARTAPKPKQQKKEIKKIVANEKTNKEAPKIIEPKLPEQKIIPPVVAQTVQPVPESETIRIGQEEYDALCLYADVKQEIERVWRPPAGIVPQRSCILKIELDERGKVEENSVEIQESSNLISYDLTARMALLQATFPERLARKELIIVFNQ